MLFLNKTLLITSLISFLISIFLLFNNMFITIYFPILSLYYFQLPISLILDWFSLMFLSTVMFISSMIMKFSMSYIPNNQHSLFSILMLMFIMSMSILILSDNIFFILLGWDGLGFSSYILVVYYQNSLSAASGSITILSNRIGDIMILLSIAISFSFMNWNFMFNKNFPMIIMFLLMIAAMSKSAQFPFSAWLPAAMSAPTPISALVHSSTLVTAGVYLMIRIMNFFHPTSMYIMMIISSLTAIYASMAALWEQDMKKIIALSTLSQMAMMMFAISLNSINSAYFHLISHALFKSMMFLCAGILIHNFMYQDMRHMGSMYLNSPIPLTMLGISNLSLMGMPFMSGFFSKDIIIEKLINSDLIKILSIMMILSISLTSMYSMRMMIYSSKFITKSKPDLNMKWNFQMENSIIFMSLFPIIMGSMMSWMMLPLQNFIIPLYLKISIMISFFLGILLSMSLSFKNLMYKNLGESAISIWFSHFISSNITIITNPMIMKFSNNDKNWQETYGPKNIFLNFKKISKFPNSLSFSLLSLMILISFIPLMML